MLSGDSETSPTLTPTCRPCYCNRFFTLPPPLAVTYIPVGTAPSCLQKLPILYLLLQTFFKIKRLLFVNL
jgi:hypothetical protein